MAREEALVALPEFGQPEPFRRVSGPQEDLVVALTTSSLFVYCDAEGCVEAVEFASPGRGVPADDRILFDGIDLFQRPADEVVDMLVANGFAVTSEEGGYASTVPDVLLSLWRDGDPCDEATGLPRYFESALIAAPGYYD